MGKCEMVSLEAVRGGETPAADGAFFLFYFTGQSARRQTDKVRDPHASSDGKTPTNGAPQSSHPQSVKSVNSAASDYKSTAAGSAAWATAARMKPQLREQ